MNREPDADTWNSAICDWFFHAGNADRPVYLCVDAPELARVAAAQDFAVDDPRSSFVEAMASCCRLPSDPFSYWRLATRRWDGEGTLDGRPPFVALLALTTLAANESARPGRRPSLYAPVARLLRADEGAVRRDYEGAVRRWWDRLGEWLRSKDGRFGLATWSAPTHGFRSIIGHAWSQVLVRASDRSDFTEFFECLGVPRGEELDLDPRGAPTELLARWRVWVRRGGPVSCRLRPVVDDPSGDLAGLVARILFDELVHWDGKVRDAGRSPTVQLVVTANTFDRHELSFAAVVPEGLAGRALTVAGVPVELGDVDDLVEVPVPVTRDALDHGVRSEGESLLRYSPRTIVPMACRGVDLWRSVNRLEPGEEAYALVADQARDAFFSVVPEPRRSLSVRNVPDGWSLFRDVETRTDHLQVGTETSGLVARASDLPHLRGGLRTAAGSGRRYLQHAPPDIVVPGVEGVRTEVCVNGEVVERLGPEGGVVRLARLSLGQGDHNAIAGSRRFGFSLEPFDWCARVDAPALAHVLAVADDAGRWEVRAPQASDAAVVTGALVGGAPVAEASVRLVPASGTAVLLGRPGETAEVMPAMAPWASRAGLPLKAFEPLSPFGSSGGRPFVPTWAFLRQAADSELALLTDDLDLRSTGPVPLLVGWARAVVAIDRDARPCNGAEALWARYVAAAREVLGA
jgi:hypothetical protein